VLCPSIFHLPLPNNTAVQLTNSSINHQVGFPHARSQLYESVLADLYEKAGFPDTFSGKATVIDLMGSSSSSSSSSEDEVMSDL
jgi:hypothetical protein